MLLKEILQGVQGIKGRGSLDIEIKTITQNENEKVDGYLYVATNGDIQTCLQAIRNGANSILIDDDRKSLINELYKFDLQRITIFVLENISRDLPKILYNFYKVSLKGLKLIGIYGSNGKTEAALMLKNIFDRQKIKNGFISNRFVMISQNILSQTDIMLNPINFYKVLNFMKQNGCQNIILEIPYEVAGSEMFNYITFDYLAINNIIEDDQGSALYNSNIALNLVKRSINIFCNGDDFNVLKICGSIDNPNLVTYSADNYSNNIAKDITVTNRYLDYKLKMDGKNERIKVKSLGRENVYNSLVAILIARRLEIPTETIKQALELSCTLGRREYVLNETQVPIMIDFEDDQDNQARLLKDLKRYSPGKIIIITNKKDSMPLEEIKKSCGLIIFIGDKAEENKSESVYTKESVEDAITFALEKIKRSDIILYTNIIKNYFKERSEVINLFNQKIERKKDTLSKLFNNKK